MPTTTKTPKPTGRKRGGGKPTTDNAKALADAKADVVNGKGYDPAIPFDKRSPAEREATVAAERADKRDADKKRATSDAKPSGKPAAKRTGKPAAAKKSDTVKLADRPLAKKVATIMAGGESMTVRDVVAAVGDKGPWDESTGRTHYKQVYRVLYRAVTDDGDPLYRKTGNARFKSTGK